jgi:hypothetical protein
LGGPERSPPILFGFLIPTNTPTFACAAYKKIVRKKGDVAVEFYLYPGQKYTEKMIDYTFKVVGLKSRIDLTA